MPIGIAADKLTDVASAERKIVELVETAQQEPKLLVEAMPPETEDESWAFIEADGLTKRFGERTALDGWSLEVASGEIVALLGPNGAGKTTTMSILAGALMPDSGRARVCGYDIATAPYRARRKFGLVPQSLALYPSLSALENLRFFGRI